MLDLVMYWYSYS